ncbi:MAG: BatD family protein [Bacteroidales bacterium]|nr:BatD family protein [Bacteroidales bacterium]
MMTKRFNIRYILTAVALVCAMAVGFAQKFELTGVQNVVQGRKFAVTFRLSNAQGNPPQAPELKGCRYYSGPEISTIEYSSNYNGRVEHTVMYDFTYVYIADEEGTVTVPALTVNAGGKRLTSRSATFRVLPAEAGAPGRPVGGSGQQQPAQSTNGRQKGRRTSSDDLLVRVSFSKSNVYEQEAVIASIKVYTKLEIKSFRVVQQPEFEGFLSEELPVSQRVDLEHYNGQNYYAAELKKCLLYPQKSGKLTLNTGKYDVTVVHEEPVTQGFWVTMRPVEENITTTSNAASLQVTPLPEPRPAGFSGAVGKFSVSTELNPEIMKTNEASTYSYIITGTGNIKYLKEPEISFPGSFDAYTPKTDINARFTGSNTSGTYRIDYPIVPQEVGKFEIPATRFIYFDPTTRQYVTLDTRAYNVNVARGAAVAATAGAQKSVSADMDDIRHIHALPSVTEAAPAPVFGRMWYWLCYAAVLLILVIVVIVYRRKLKLDADVTGRRLARANRVASKRFKTAASFMKAHKDEQFYEELARALKGYIGDKLGIAPSQLISDTIVGKLTAYGAAPETADNVVEVLNECEMARFTPSSSDAAMSEVYDRAVAAIKAIEDVKTQK